MINYENGKRVPASGQSVFIEDSGLGLDDNIYINVNRIENLFDIIISIIDAYGSCIDMNVANMLLTIAESGKISVKILTAYTDKLDAEDIGAAKLRDKKVAL